jgi:type III restriction enzyme
VPADLKNNITYYYLNTAFKDETETLKLPQFVIDTPPSIFSEKETALLTPERLAEGFRLSSKEADISFSALDAEIAKIDIEGTSDAIPKAWKLAGTDNEFFKSWFNSNPAEKRIRICADLIVSTLSRNNTINDRDLRDYVSRVIDTMSPEQVDDLQQSPFPYAQKIKTKIESLLTEHSRNNFDLLIEQGKIRCEPCYMFTNTISPLKTVTTIPHSLYTAEEDMNGLEKDIVWELANLPNIKWWHRNISRKGFAINGFINAYPDIIVQTQSGKILMIEAKGDHFGNEDSLNKVTIGRIWQNKAGENYRYYMVFRNREFGVEGAYHFDRFLEIVKGL